MARSTIPISLSDIICKHIGMVSCSLVHLCCVMTPCYFLFGASSHPFILKKRFIHLFPPFLMNSYDNTAFSYYRHSDLHVCLRVDHGDD